LYCAAGRNERGIQRLTLTADLVVGLMWLVIGGAAWIVALNVGLQRYWRR
jgi:hypothetical protein